MTDGANLEMNPPPPPPILEEDFQDTPENDGLDDFGEIFNQMNDLTQDLDQAFQNLE